MKSAFSVLAFHSTFGFISQLQSYCFKLMSEMQVNHRKMRRQVDGKNPQSDLVLGAPHFLVKMILSIATVENYV